ncbi:YeeE/YedE family protein [Gammaproteobacteria bacterium]|nr:YeeE/YedE family protein [Gammaproteobacteria bacterium]
MWEVLGIDEDSLRQVSAVCGLGIGLLFGLAAQRSRFCLRRAVIDVGQMRDARALWIFALAVAVLLTQALVFGNAIDLDQTRYFSGSLALSGLVGGGLLFGAGMVLTRGCVSRMTVLAAGGNLRAWMVLLVFAVVAHATMKGVLAPVRIAIGDTLQLPIDVSKPLLVGPPALAVGFFLVVIAGVGALRSRLRPTGWVYGAVIGACIAAGWLTTGWLLHDEFAPLPIESFAFTAPWGDSLFYTLASSALELNFGIGLIGGVLLGAFVAALFAGELLLQSFESPKQTLRYLSGAAMMGFGGVLAGGCSVGNGLSGVSTLALSPIIALVSIVAGARLAQALLHGHPPRHRITQQADVSRCANSSS